MTDDLIIQVADRWLTNATTGQVVDDEFTKLVCQHRPAGRTGRCCGRADRPLG